jgi:hypothetical protein
VLDHRWALDDGKVRPVIASVVQEFQDHPQPGRVDEHQSSQVENKVVKSGRNEFAHLIIDFADVR